jgi:hypothetical protein
VKIEPMKKMVVATAARKGQGEGSGTHAVSGLRVDHAS